MVAKKQTKHIDVENRKVKLSSKASKKNKKILVSIIMPTYNRAHCILDSVASVLKQDTDSTNLNWELIISDDASTDDTESLFAKSKNLDPRIIYFRASKNGGVNVARNLAIKRAHGDYVLFLDSDDFLTSDAFNILSQYLPSTQKILLFSTNEVATSNLMTHVSNDAAYTYRQWLEAKDVNGEFLSVVDAAVFSKDMFDEERFCFESFFWNRIVKKYGVFASSKVLREYSFSSDNRVSKKLSDPAYAARRFKDYIVYIQRFGIDYRDADLLDLLANLYAKTSLFGILGGQKKEALLYLKQSFSIKRTGFGVCVCFFSLIPRPLDVFVYKIIHKMMNIQ